jgi:hypothetical protein
MLHSDDFKLNKARSDLKHANNTAFTNYVFIRMLVTFPKSSNTQFAYVTGQHTCFICFGIGTGILHHIFISRKNWISKLKPEFSFSRSVDYFFRTFDKSFWTDSCTYMSIPPKLKNTLTS